MEKLKIELNNCYGIPHMKLDIDFMKKNVAVIYAPNGTMKTSLAKTFLAVSQNREPEERIFGLKSEYLIEDGAGNSILSNNIMVINPFEENAYENQGLLMANENLRKKFIHIHKKIDDKKMTLFEEIKLILHYSKRSKFEVENTLVNDFNTSKKQIYKCLEDIRVEMDNEDTQCSLDTDELDYSILFNDKVYKVITQGETSVLLNDYEKKYSELVEKSLYMRNGIIDHNNYENIYENLNNNGFFKANNEVILVAKDNSTSITIKTHEELKRLIQDEKEKILNSTEIKILFEKINKVISANKDMLAFNMFLQNHQEIINEYKDIERFKRKVWIKAFSKYKNQLEELLDEYDEAKKSLKELMDEAKKETTDWSKALEVFKKRFYVPFNIKPSNQEDVILNQDMPSFKYIFDKEDVSVDISKEKLLQVLSTGEKGAYYILNFIFQVLVRKEEEQETVLVLDDISESFDYKNKYAIIEYINDISMYTDDLCKKKFFIIILTHNFDFYRTVASRITGVKNSYIAYKNEKEILCKDGQYTKNVFSYFKEQVKKNNPKFFIASIPFVRNLIEFMVAEPEKNKEYFLLTNILHYKDKTKSITIKQIQDIYNKYWFIGEEEKIQFTDEAEESIYGLILQIADKIDDVEKIEIENKIILSVAIRLIGEECMIEQIKKYAPNGKDIIAYIYSHKQQTGRLLSAYKENVQYLEEDDLVLLNQIGMITPENIHLNSFMYEPILDMSISHLYNLYKEVKELQKERIVNEDRDRSSLA